MDTERTVRDKYLHDADLALADIDRALAPPIDIDELVYHPNQFVYDAATAPWYAVFADGDLPWEEATKAADRALYHFWASVRGTARLYGDWKCWRCEYITRRGAADGPAPGDDLCHGCRETIDLLVSRSESDKPYHDGWCADWMPDNVGAHHPQLGVDGAYDRPAPFKSVFATFK